MVPNLYSYFPFHCGSLVPFWCIYIRFWFLMWLFYVVYAICAGGSVAVKIHGHQIRASPAVPDLGRDRCEYGERPYTSMTHPPTVNHPSSLPRKLPSVTCEWTCLLMQRASISIVFRTTFLPWKVFTSTCILYCFVEHSVFSSVTYKITDAMLSCLSLGRFSTSESWDRM